MFLDLFDHFLSSLLFLSAFAVPLLVFFLPFAVCYHFAFFILSKWGMRKKKMAVVKLPKHHSSTKTRGFLCFFSALFHVSLHFLFSYFKLNAPLFFLTSYSLAHSIRSRKTPAHARNEKIFYLNPKKKKKKSLSCHIHICCFN